MATREDFVGHFKSDSEATDFEGQVLSIGTELLPCCALNVRDRLQEPTAEYWDFLISQIEATGNG